MISRKIVAVALLFTLGGSTLAMAQENQGRIGNGGETFTQTAPQQYTLREGRSVYSAPSAMTSAPVLNSLNWMGGNGSNLPAH